MAAIQTAIRHEFEEKERFADVDLKNEESATGEFKDEMLEWRKKYIFGKNIDNFNESSVWKGIWDEHCPEMTFDTLENIISAIRNVSSSLSCASFSKQGMLI